jgi:hypothetical protein
MDKVDFFALPRPLQDRILGGIDGRFPPVPIARRPGRVEPPYLWIGVAGACLVFVLVLHRLGYGSLESGLAHHGAGLLPLYIAPLIGFFGSVGMVARTYVRAARLPYPLGVYAYGARVLDASTHPIKSYPLVDALNIETMGESVVLTFAGGVRFVLPTPPGQAEHALHELLKDREQFARLGETSDPNALLMHDPLHEPKIHNPLGEQEPMRFELPIWIKLAWAIAAVAGLLLGLGFWGLRNAGSDGKLFARAQEANSPAAFKAYLASGSRHQVEVSRTLLPRAELVEAEKAGTVESLLAYEREHPDTDIKDEVARAKRRAYTAELDRAKAQGTLAALQAFAKKYPGHGLDAEYKGAVHDRFLAAQATFGTTQGGRSKEAAQLFAQLLGYAEAHGPGVELRFRRRESPSLGRIDKTVAKLPEYMGEISRPSRYLDEPHLTQRERDTAAQQVAAFNKVFPAELLVLRAGDALPAVDPKAALPSVQVPTMVITYMPEWSGHTYASKKPRGIFIGLFFHFEVDVLLPGQAGAAYHMKVSIFRGYPNALMKELESVPRTNPPIEERVYAFMAEEAFKQFDAKLKKALHGE